MFEADHQRSRKGRSRLVYAATTAGRRRSRQATAAAIAPSGAHPRRSRDPRLGRWIRRPRPGGRYVPPRSGSGYLWHPRAQVLSGAPVQMFYFGRAGRPVCVFGSHVTDATTGTQSAGAQCGDDGACAAVVMASSGTASGRHRPRRIESFGPVASSGRSGSAAGRDQTRSASRRASSRDTERRRGRSGSNTRCPPDSSSNAPAGYACRRIQNRHRRTRIEHQRVEVPEREARFVDLPRVATPVRGSSRAGPPARACGRRGLTYAGAMWRGPQ
jgi:hypothetical protein